jgi:hypothetical protein
VSGALAERVFVKKLENVGFDRIEVVERTPFGIDDASHYPLFTPEVIGLMHELLMPRVWLSILRLPDTLHVTGCFARHSSVAIQGRHKRIGAGQFTCGRC